MKKNIKIQMGMIGKIIKLLIILVKIYCVSIKLKKFLLKCEQIYGSHFKDNGAEFICYFDNNFKDVLTLWED